MPPSAISNLPFLKAIRAGEGAALMSKEFVLEQRFREGDTVDDHQRHVLAQTPLVDGTGEEFLPCPAFPKQQHTGIGLRGALGGLHHRTDLRAHAHNRRVAPVDF